MKRTIRNSAKALIIKDKNEEWYIMPGDGQESEELLEDTVCREVAEEMEIEVTPKELGFVIEDVGDPECLE